MDWISCFLSHFTFLMFFFFFFWGQMPGTIMAMGRLNRPSIMVYGGTIKVWDFTFHNFFDFANIGVQFFFGSK